MNYLFVFSNLLLLTSVSYWFYTKWKPSVKFFWLSFSYRIGMGFAMGLIYTYYYAPSDTWTYFHDAEKLADVGREDFTFYLKALFDDASNISNYVTIVSKEWRSVFFVKLVSVFCWLSLNNYWICSAYFSFISFASSWFIHRTLCKWKPDAELASAIAFIIFPSIAFWASGVGKESLAFGGLCILSAILLKYKMEEKIRLVYWTPIVIAFFILFKLRYFWLAAFVIAFVPTLIFIFLTKRKVKKSVTIFSIASILLILIISLSFLHPILSPAYFLDVVVYNHNKLMKVSNPDNVIHFQQLSPTLSSFIRNMPLALLSGLFRPFIGEGSGILGWAASLENLFLFIMTIPSLANLKRAMLSKNSVLLVSSATYIILLCLFLALSTPNLGSLSRYRIGFLPFFVFIICYQNPLVKYLQEMFKLKVIQ